MKKIQRDMKLELIMNRIINCSAAVFEKMYTVIATGIKSEFSLKNVSTA